MSAPLSFPPAGPDPKVTLIMVVHGGYETTLRSLRALATSTSGDHEVMVVDNASPDGAGRRLTAAVEGVAFVMNDRNLGYGPAVNLAALRARGRFLAVLNSDIEPEPGWLEPLVDALESDDRAGAATPMYLRPDGSVQEAGGLLDRDGNGYGYGDRLGAEAAEVGFARYVDYGSAAALLVSRPAFEAVGGFDARYGLGYYEDADLSFAMRELGFLTVFEPRSKVVHHGQGSFTSRARARQARRNRVLFANRFAGQLAGRPGLSRPPYDPHRELIVRDWWARERFLVVDRNGTLGPLAEHIQRLRPLDRVTHLGPGRSPTGRPGRFVEPGPAAGTNHRWLAGRRHHYSVVVCSDGLPGPTRATLARTQPQAVTSLVAAGADPPAAALRVLAEAGLGRS